MPICTINLITLDTGILDFLQSLEQAHIKPLIIARIVRWIIKPNKLSMKALLNQEPPWDLLLIQEGPPTPWPQSLHSMVQARWSIQAGIPASVTRGFQSRNALLLNPNLSDVPPLPQPLSTPRKPGSAQLLELDEELHRWISDGAGPKGAVSMLNLLAFHPGKQSQYLKYGKAFAESVGRRRGGLAKLVGKIIPGSCSDGCDGWDEASSR